MYKKIIAFVVLLSFCFLHLTKIDAQETTINLLGEIVYCQDFENLSSIEPEYFKSNKFSVVQLDNGNSALQVDGSGVADITTGEIGPQTSGNIAVTADLKQLGCTAASSAYFALGVSNSIDDSGKYNGYRFAYSDTIRFDNNSPYKIGVSSEAVRYRDVLSIARANNTNRMESLYYGAYNYPVGILDNSKRTFDNFYQMRASVVDDILTNAIYDAEGNLEKLVSTSSNQINKNITDCSSLEPPSGGKLILNSHSTNMLVDNIKIRKIISATNISASVSKNRALLGEQLTININAISEKKQQALDPDTLSYIYDKEKLCVDTKNGLVKPIAFGNHELIIKANDVSGNGSISCTLNVECSNGYDVSIENPSLDVGESSYFSVYRLTSEGAKEIKNGYHIECSQGIIADAESQKITALYEGLHQIYVTVDNVEFTYPISVCDKSVYTDADSSDSFVYDFDDNVSPLNFTFSNSAKLQNVTDDNKKVVSINGVSAHGTSTMFGNNYTEYYIYLDFRYLSSSTPVDASFGVGVKAGASGHYQVSYSPACKINTSTGQIDSGSTGTNMKDRLIISYASSNSGQDGNMLRKHKLLAYSHDATGALGTNSFDKYYRLKVKVSATDITAQLINLSNGDVMTSISATTDTDIINNSGQTLLNVANANVYVDRLELVPFAKVNKLELTTEKNEVELGKNVKVISKLEGTDNILTTLNKLELIYDPDDIVIDTTNSCISAKWQGSKYLTAVYNGTDGIAKYATIRISQPIKTTTDFQCTDIHFYDEFGEEMQYMPYAGNVRTEISVKNQLAVDSDIVFLAVAYNYNNNIIGLGYTKAFVKSGENITENVTVAVNEVNDTAYIEVFAVDNFINLKPMFSKKILQHMQTRVNWR